MSLEVNMIKFITNILLLVFLFIQFSCQTDKTPITNLSTPEWLNSYIEEIQDNPDYYGTKIYRYEWREKFVYHVMIPISSCAYCEVYDQSGIKIDFRDDSNFQDFLNHKKNEVVVWEWKNNN
jgi:hypothetical protein